MLRHLFATLSITVVAAPMFFGQVCNAGTITKEQFRNRILANANGGSIATDVLGGWANIWEMLLLAKYMDNELYREALLKLARDTENCKNEMSDSAYLACGIDVGANAAADIGLIAAAAEFRQDAETFAKENAAKDPLKVIDIVLSAVKTNRLSYAQQAIEEIEGFQKEHALILDPARRYQISMIKTKLSDARLDREGTLQALKEVIDLAIKDRSRFKNSDQDRIVDKDLNDLIYKYYTKSFCGVCGERGSILINSWVHEALSRDEHKSSNDTQYGEFEYYLLTYLAPNSAYKAGQREAYSKRFLKLYSGQGVDPEKLARKMMAKHDPVEAATLISLAEYVGGHDTAAFINILSEKNNQKQAKALRQAIKQKIEDFFEQFGLETGIAPFLEKSSRYLQATGHRNAAKVVLEILAERNPKAANGNSTERIALADVYAPALARLASAELASGNFRAAKQHLLDASDLIRVRLRQEWTSAEERTILAIRDFTPALRLIAQKWSEIIVKGGFSRNQPNHDVLFQSMQAALFGETALALEIASQRRLLDDISLKEARRKLVKTSGDAERAEEIAAYSFTVGDVDGTLARRKQSTAQSRDTARREFESRLPIGLRNLDDIEVVKISEAMDRLQPEEALVLLHVGSHGLYGFLLDKEGNTFAWRTDIHAGVIEDLVRSVRTIGDTSGGGFPALRVSDSYKLYQLMFGPLGETIQNYRKLVLIGDGPLQAMPYGLLLKQQFEQSVSDGATLRAAKPKWLIRSHAIALLPSVRMLIAQRSNGAHVKSSKSFLGVGDPLLADASGDLRSIDLTQAFINSSGSMADVGFLRQLVSLPETADELRAIAKLLRAPDEDIMLASEANERSVRARTLSDYRIVAFATHGALAGQVNGISEPGLVLTPPIEATREDDGYLALSEIIGLKFDADLIILSACNTATSDGRPQAEGLSGLARGFFVAGARNLLATHWAIPSEASAKITTGVIAQRTARPELDWSEALREATLAVMDQDGPDVWAHPAYWAGFTTVGVLSK